MVFDKDVEGDVDGDVNEPRGVRNGKHIEKANDNNKAKTIEVYWACFQRK